MESISSASSEVSVFHRLHMDDVPERKRLHRRLLSYIQTHYFRIISILLLSVIVLVTVIVILAIRAPTDLVVHENTVGNYSLKEDLQTAIVNDVVNKDPHIEVSTSISDVSILSIPCRKIKCPTNLVDPCFIGSLGYSDVKYYSCCGCLKQYRLVRYEHLRRAEVTSMILAGSEVDPCSMSNLDLRLLPQLHNIDGSWDIVQETDTLCHLKYNMNGVGRVNIHPIDISPKQDLVNGTIDQDRDPVGIEIRKTVDQKSLKAVSKSLRLMDFRAVSKTADPKSVGRGSFDVNQTDFRAISKTADPPS